GHPAPSIIGDGSPGSGQGSDSDRPQPSISDTSREGLIGGTTGDLLNPPQNDTSSSTPSSGGKTTSTEEPEVTVPPLLPGLLPSLGIDNQDTN
ncbi:hypothetical protein PV366_43890, partial [Streptomyces ipomoeae]|nr:hypothetical protein [Streptomyces ipomoeae]